MLIMLLEKFQDFFSVFKVIIESDNEISVYAIRVTDSYSTGYSILPVDILGTNYNVYLDVIFKDSSVLSSSK